jgi:TonB family protein
MRLLFLPFLLFIQLLAAQSVCLPGSPVAANYPVTAEGLKNLFETAQQRAELTPAAYEDLKTQINRCNNEMEVALSGIVSQMSELSLKYQQILGYKDVAGIEKQLRDLEESRKKSRVELEQNLGYVKHSGIFVVLLEGVDFYKKEKKDLIAEANQVITPRAVEDLVGVHIRRASESRDFLPVRDVVQEIKDGEVRMEREYFNQSNHVKKYFLLVARIGATPSRQKAGGAGAAASNALVINLSSESNYRQRLLERGVNDADIKRIEQEVLPFLPNVQRDNKTADGRQDYILQNGTEKVRGLDRDIEDARLRLQTRSGKIAEICKELGVPFGNSNFDQSVSGALQKIKDQLGGLTAQWNQTTEREIIYKDTRTFVEGSLSQSLAAEALKLCGQLEKGYGQLDRILQVTEVENFDVSKFENSRTVTVYRLPQKIWAYAMPRDDGSYGVVTFAQFKVTGKKTDPDVATVQAIKAKEEERRRVQEAAEKARREQEERDKRKSQVGGAFGKPGATGSGQENIGKPGNQGVPGGTGDNPFGKTSGMGGGIGGGPGNVSGGSVGDGFGNRRVSSWGRIEDRSQATGKVAIEVCVDASGRVISAEFTHRGSTTSDSGLKSKALAAAKQTRFQPSDSSKQCGTLTFNFRLK